MIESEYAQHIGLISLCESIQGINVYRNKVIHIFRGINEHRILYITILMSK